MGDVRPSGTEDRTNRHAGQQLFEVDGEDVRRNHHRSEIGCKLRLNEAVETWNLCPPQHAIGPVDKAQPHQLDVEADRAQDKVDLRQL